MASPPRLDQLTRERDDLFDTLALVADDDVLTRRVLDQLVAVFVERMFAAVSQQLTEGALSRRQYVDALEDLLERCRAVGLLPIR